jgi:hypothetical protein
MCVRSILSSYHAALGQQRTVAVSGEWSTVLTLHYSYTVVACLYVLQALTVMFAHMSCRSMMALTSDAFETCACALGIGKLARLFFM